MWDHSQSTSVGVFCTKSLHVSPHWMLTVLSKIFEPRTFVTGETVMMIWNWGWLITAFHWLKSCSHWLLGLFFPQSWWHGIWLEIGIRSWMMLKVSIWHGLTLLTEINMSSIVLAVLQQTSLVLPKTCPIFHQRANASW